MPQKNQKPRISIITEYGWDESCGSFGVKVKRTQSKLDDCASMDVIYEDFVHGYARNRAVVSWDGGEVSGDYVKKLLDFVQVPEHIKNDSAFNMILRLVDIIRKENEINGEEVELDSISVSIITATELF